MSKVCFTVLLALMAADLSAQTQVPLRPADLASTNFPPRIDMRAEAIKLFDKDGDGKLNEAERSAMREARQAKAEQMRKALEMRFDKNGDGKLDDAEKAALAEAKKTVWSNSENQEKKPTTKMATASSMTPSEKRCKMIS